jgi:hypothetical protein
MKTSALLLAATALAATSLHAATTASTDYTDMWFIPAESGWGVNVTQQGDTAFLTLFVYAQNGAPMWFAGPASLSASQAAFSGTLYQTTGPYFGAAWNPAAYSARPVGTVRFAPSAVDAATLSYSVDGVAVTKSVVRQTFREENVAGTYLGASSGRFTGCSSGNGVFNSPAVWSFSQAGRNVHIVEQAGNYICTYDGTYTQQGKLGRIAGSGNCNDGFFRTFEASELEVAQHFIAARLVTQTTSCRFDGNLAAARMPAS